MRLEAIADPVRVKPMSLLPTSPLGAGNGGDLAATVGLSESTVSRHLSQPRKAGPVSSERRGMNTFHRARRDALAALCTVLDPHCCT